MITKPYTRVKVDRIEWHQVMYFQRLTSALRLSVLPNRLIMGLIIVIILMISGMLWDNIRGPAVGAGGIGDRVLSNTEIEANINDILALSIWIDLGAVPADIEDIERSITDAHDFLLELYASLEPDIQSQNWQIFTYHLQNLQKMEPVGEFAGTVIYIRKHFQAMVNSAVNLKPADALCSVLPVVTELPRLLWSNHKLFLIVFGVWFCLVWLIGGATISRSVACEFSIVQYIQWTEALAYSLKRWIPLAGTVVFPIVAIIIGIVALAFGGWLLEIKYLDVIAAIIYALALFGGFVAVCVIVLSVVSSGMFVPAVTVESADSADALSRAFSYTKNRPFHLILYLIISLILGLLGYLLVLFFAALTINFTAWGANCWGGGEPAYYSGVASMLQILPSPHDPLLPLTGTELITTNIISIWRTLIGGLVAGFVISYHFSAWTVIYFLLRKATDDQDIDEIWLPGMIQGTLAPERELSKN